jgi:hypothetical protein
MDARLEQSVKNLQQTHPGPFLFISADITRHLTLRVARLLRGKNYNQINVILQTEGGSGEAAFIIANLLRSHASQLNIFVPIFAKSAGTLICLAADKILLTNVSELGPLDAQIRERKEGDTGSLKSALNGFSALKLLQQQSLESFDYAAKFFQQSPLKLLEAMKLAVEYAASVTSPLYSKIDPKEIGEYDRELKVAMAYGIRILIGHLKWDSDKAEALVRTLVYDYPSHGFVINHDELLLLNMPAELASEPGSQHLFEIGCNLIELASEGGIVELVE